jgi:hypothetical protein
MTLSDRKGCRVVVVDSLHGPAEMVASEVNCPMAMSRRVTLRTSMTPAARTDFFWHRHVSHARSNNWHARRRCLTRNI